MPNIGIYSTMFVKVQRQVQQIAGYGLHFRVIDRRFGINPVVFILVNG